MGLSIWRITGAGLGASLLLAAGTGTFAGCAGADTADLFGSSPASENVDDAGNDPPPSDDGNDDDGDTDPGVNEKDSGGPSPDPSNPVDAGNDPVVDSGSDAGEPPKTELDPSPGQVPCGKKDCELPGKVCCSGTPDQCGNPPTSDDDTQKCKAIACDEAADCPDGQVCCLDNLNTPASYCAAKCKNQDVVRCQSDAECSGGKCETYTCSVGLFPLGKVNACAKSWLCSR